MRRLPRRPRIQPPRIAVAPAPMSALDRVHPLGLLTGGLIASLAAHLMVVGATAGMRRILPRVQPPEEVRVVVVEKPPPPKPPEPIPAPALVPTVRTHKRAVVPNAPVAAPVPTNEPPPPTHEAPTDTPPVLVSGLSLSATTGSMGVAAGNTRAAASTGAGEAHPYKAKEYAPAYALTEAPVFLDNVSPEQLRSFYPEEARQTKREGVVRVTLTIDDDGSVVKVVLVSDPGHGFGAAARRVARLYRFKPATVNGRRVATEIPFTIHFELAE